MKRRDEILVGLLLIVSVVVAIGGTIWIARGGLSQNYAMYMRFPWGSGLKQGQVVLLAGVQVGFVDNVELDPNGTVLVRLKIQEQYNIPEGSKGAVEANGIFGDQLIAVRPVLGATAFIPKNDTIPTGAGTPGMNDLLGKGDSIAIDIRALTASARTTFVEGGGIDEMNRTIASLTKLVTQVSAIAAEQSKQLSQTQLALRNTIASIDSNKVDSTLINIRATSASLEQLARELKQTNTQVQGVIAKLNENNGTAGKLLNDKAVYDHLDSVLMRVDSLMADFKKNPRRYINLKIF